MSKSNETPDIPRYVAAVGNNEMKAATFLRMPIGEALGQSAIMGLVESAQTPDGIRKTTPSVFRSYCEASFVPIGLVARVIVEDTGYTRYERLAVPTAEAVAGAMLDFSALADISLERLISVTSAPNKKKLDPEEAKRGPHNRLRILGSLLAQDSLSSVAALDANTGAGHREIAAHLKDLARLGVLDYSSHDTHTAADSLYVIKEGEHEVSGSVREEMINILRANPEGITRKDLMARLLATRTYPNNKNFITVFYRASKALEDQGVIERRGKAIKGEYSWVTLQPEWKELISELVGRLVRIESGNAQEISYWVRKGNEIVNTPELITTLIHKHFDQSQKSRAKTLGQLELRAVVMNTLTTEGQLTYTSIAEKHKDAYSLRSIRTVLLELRNEGVLSSFKDDSNRNVWSIND